VALRLTGLQKVRAVFHQWKATAETRDKAVAKAVGQTLLKLLKAPSKIDDVAYFQREHWENGLAIGGDYDAWALQKAMKGGMSLPAKGKDIGWKREYAAAMMERHHEQAKAAKVKQEEEYNDELSLYNGCVGNAQTPAADLTPPERLKSALLAVYPRPRLPRYAGRRTKSMVPYLEQLLNAISKMVGSRVALVAATQFSHSPVMSPWA
jgi:hypothetical protein